MFIWSELYQVVVYIPPGEDKFTSLCVWLVPGSEGL
jgi:hypothetical protein